MLGRTEIAVFSFLLCCVFFKTGLAGAGLCFPEHPQAAVCRAKFVIRATVISVDWDEDLKKKDAPTTVATTKAVTQAPTTAEVTEAATQPPSTAAATKAATTAVETEAATTDAATKAPTTKEVTVEATTAAKTEAPTTTEATKAPPTIAETTAAVTEAATTKAATQAATDKAVTEAATTKEATQAATTKVATEAATKAATEKPVKTTSTEIKENEIESNKKATTTEENNEDQGDSNPIFEPAFMGQAAYFLKPKIIRLELRKLYKGLRVVNTKIGEQLNITFSSPHRTHMEVGKTYLLTGFSYDNTLLMNECNWHREWDELTTTQKLGLRRYYWLYCRCNIRFCPGGSCARNPRVCSWVVPLSLIDGKKADLLSSYSVCMVRCGGCGWHNPKELVDCSRA